MSPAGPHRALTPLVEASTQLRALCLQTWGCAPTMGTAVPVSTNREPGTRKNGKELMAKNCPPKNHLTWAGGRTGLQNNRGVSAFLIFIKVWWHSKNSFTQLVKNSLSCALYLALREGHALWETLSAVCTALPLWHHCSLLCFLFFFSPPYLFSYKLILFKETLQVTSPHIF